ncbi:glycosyl hydrolase family 28-related protein [Chryseobacterium cucumeris]|uniref:glycosyl hydrolase family 28-related protein n=1 Tax=Chryseobacterium cucumeris TaxID=1813611 RepID=UPI0032079613
MGNSIPIPFLEVESIDGLPEKTSLEPDGNMLYQAADGKEYRIKTDSFYQLIHSVAKPILPSDSGSFIPNSWYKPSVYSADPGTNYPNAGNLKAIEGFDTLFYYNGSTWSKVVNKLPIDQDPRKALKSFMYPEGDGPWVSMAFPSNENQGYILNQNGVGEVQPNGAYGDIYASDLVGVSSLRITAPGMDQFGTTISWWIGYRANNTFDVLKSGIIVNGIAQINTDPQYTRYKYSRPLNGAVLEKRSKVALPVEEDSVIKAIESMGSGYSGLLDLTTLGVSTSNTAVQNTEIINTALEAEYSNPNPRTLKLPAGIFKVNEIISKPGIELSGASNLRTTLTTDVGSNARYIIMLPDGLIGRGFINNLVIDARNTTEGGIYINNTFDFQIRNCAIFTNALAGIKLKGCLYHAISDIYFDGGDIGLQIINAQASSSTAMATNLIKYDRLYFVKAKKKCVELNAGSNYVFNSCNFEDSGISGDDTTGGVHAIGLSPGGEGVDVAFNNCWSEGIRGGFIYKFDNCKGNSVIRDCMMGKGGNGTGTISNAIINIGSRLVLSGATRFSTAPHFNPFPTNIRTESGGITLVDNPNINTGINNVGAFKIAQYS